MPFFRFGFEREVFKKEPLANLQFREESLSSMLMGRVEKEIDNSRSGLKAASGGEKAL